MIQVSANLGAKSFPGSGRPTKAPGTWVPRKWEPFVDTILGGKRDCFCEENRTRDSDIVSFSPNISADPPQRGKNATEMSCLPCALPLMISPAREGELQKVYCGPAVMPRALSGHYLLETTFGFGSNCVLTDSRFYNGTSMAPAIIENASSHQACFPAPNATR